MKLSCIAVTAVIVLLFLSCSQNKSSTMQKDLAINNELKKITSLLQDGSFALEMAKNQDAAYYISQGQTVPAFLPDSADTSTIVRSLKEEKIATNIAAFYALECGIGALINQKGRPGEWLNKLDGNNWTQQKY
jgi:hypothetical protein